MISCDHHDYIEIACMYHFSVELTLKSNESVVGIAQTIVLNQKKEECISVNNNDKTILVVLTELVSMRALQVNPHFDLVSFCA